jgi:maleate isomerase
VNAAALPRQRRVYGHEGRIGLIVPANNSVIEPELWSALPAGMSLHATRVPARGSLTAAAVRRMEKKVDAAVDVLASTQIDVLAYCDMVTTFIMEEGWNAAAVERFTARTGIPCVTAWTALLDALETLGVHRLGLGTPYPRGIHDLVPPILEARGFSIASHATLDITAMSEVPTVDRVRLGALVKGLDLTGCQAVVLLATDLPTFGSIAELEQYAGIPVLTSNQTILWGALRVLGKRSGPTLGRLSEA